MRDELIVYGALVLVGAFAGLVRHARSKKEHGLKAAAASAGVSVILGLGVVGTVWGPNVVENPFGPGGFVLLIGFFQPNLSSYMGTLLEQAASVLKSKS